MRREPTRLRLPKQRGFSLLEILVVVIILSIITGAVGLSYFRSDTEKTVAVAEEVRNQIAAIRDTAILRGRPYSIAFEDNAYMIFTVNRDSKLTPVTDGSFPKENRLPEGIRFASLDIPQSTDPEDKALFIDATGLLPGFSLRIDGAGETVTLNYAPESGFHVTRSV